MQIQLIMVESNRVKLYTEYVDELTPSSTDNKGTANTPADPRRFGATIRRITRRGLLTRRSIKRLNGYTITRLDY